jgi:nucleoside-diphosphate-sugar epimerase
MQSGHHEPINLGQDRMITINELVDIISNIAGKKIRKCIGLGTTYTWIRDHMMKTGRLTSEEHNTHSLESFQYQNPAFNPKNN